jgi:hypothetical protein
MPGWVLALLFLPAASLWGQAPAGSLRVLFLGNSLTDGNDVPSLVQAMAELQDVRVEYDAVAPGGYAIEDHWRDNRQALLGQRHYDVLILQQGPSTLPESQANLREWAATWADEARRHHTQPALYMVWPQRNQVRGFALVAQSYRNAADFADAAIFPAGEAWEDVLEADPSIALYSSDGLHATPAGSFLAAMVIARGLVGLDPVRVPTRVDGITVSANTLTRFRNAVGLIEPHSFTATAPAPPASTPPTTNPPPPATPTSPASGSSGGGGGAPSAWFLPALAVLAFARLAGRLPPTSP